MEEGSGLGDCETSTYGCCPDGVTSASGPKGKGCTGTVTTDDSDKVIATTSSPSRGKDSHSSPLSLSGTKDKKKYYFVLLNNCLFVAKIIFQQNEYFTSKRPIMTWQPLTSGQGKCDAPSQRGPCTDYVVRWYFNTTLQECAQFWYGGCQGNNNRYETRDECEAECTATETPTTEDPGRAFKQKPLR